MPEMSAGYVGRFAPTPSGPLHFGSILAALGSYLDARSNRGLWLLRIDDLDTPRIRAGASDQVLFALDKLGMHWDGNILYQSQRHEAYRENERTLQSMDLLFPCYCSRKLVKGKRYPGTCRDRQRSSNQQFSIRIKAGTGNYVLHDQIQSDYSQDLAGEIGDFVIRRADGIYAYHLAVVVDDAHQNISHMIRGADLMDSCPRQIYLQQQLGLTTPVYAHLPLAVTPSGIKISKQHMAEDVLLNRQPTSILFACLEFLGQNPSRELLKYPVDEVIKWGIENWKLSNIPNRPEIIAPGKFLSSASGRTTDSTI